MRALSLPLAVFFALMLYGLLPSAKPFLNQQVSRLYASFLRLFTRKNGQADEQIALPLFVLLFAGIAQLIGAIHPVAAALLMALPLQGFVEIPSAISVQEELNRGIYVNNIPVYETLVRSTCVSLTQCFAAEALLPFLISALSAPIQLNCALCAAYFVLKALPALPFRRVDAFLSVHARLADRLMQALLLLCSCVVGRNPFHTRGDDASARMLSILDIRENDPSARAPVSGDIAQALLLCSLCLFIAVLIMTLALLAVL